MGRKFGEEYLAGSGDCGTVVDDEGDIVGDMGAEDVRLLCPIQSASATGRKAGFEGV